jgi:hypothetical protein
LSGILRRLRMGLTYSGDGKQRTELIEYL